MPADYDLRGKIGLAFWAVVMAVTCAYLLAGHLLTLPKPPLTSNLRSLLQDNTGFDDQSWHVVHVLYSECRCSQDILEHLLSTERPKDIREKIEWVADDPMALSPAILQKAHTLGFIVEYMTPKKLAQVYHIEAAPLLLIADAQGDLRYVGGYAQHPRGPSQDIEIIQALRVHRNIVPRPLFGCAVSQTLRHRLNPATALADIWKGLQ